MKKIKGCGCITLILLSALSIVACAFAFNSKVQTSFANSFLAKSFEGSSLKSLHILPWSASVKGLDLKMDAAEISLEDANVKFSPLSLLSKTLDISSAEAKGLKVSLAEKSAPKKEKTAEEKSESAGMPNWNIKIAEFKSDIQIELADKTKLKTNISLANFDSAELVKVKSMDFKAENIIEFEGRLSAINIQASAIPKGGSTNFAAVVEKSAKRILQIQGKIDASYEQIETEIQLIADSGDLKDIIEFAPNFDINLHAKTNFTSDFKRVKNQTLLKASIAGLDDFRKKIANENIPSCLEFVKTLEGINETSLSGDLALELEDKMLSLSNFEFLLSANKEQLVQIKNAGAFKLDMQNISQIPDGDLIFVSIPNLPLSFINSFTGKALTLKGSGITGELILSKKGGEFLASTKKDFAINNFEIVKDGQSILKTKLFALGVNGKSDGTNHRAVKIATLKSDSDKVLRIAAQADYANEKLVLTTSVDGNISSFAPNLKLNEDINTELNTALSFEQKVLSLNSFGAKITGDKTGEILSAKQLSKISFNTDSKEISLLGSLFQVESKNVPFALIKPFALGANADDFSLNLAVSAKNKNEIHADLKASLKNMSFEKDGIYLLKNLTPELAVSVDANLEKKLASVNAPEIRVSDSNSIVIAGSASANAEFAKDFDLKDASAKLSAALPALMNQPVLEKFNNVSGGILDADAKFADGKATLKATLHNVSPKMSADVAGKMEAIINATLVNFEPKLLSANISGESKMGKTQIEANATLDKDIIVDLLAQSIATDDFEILAKSFSNPLYKSGSYTPQQVDNAGKRRIIRPAEAAQIQAQEKTSEEKIDEKALWDFGKNLQLDLKINQIQRRQKIILSKLDANAKIDSNNVSAQIKNAKIFGADFSSQILMLFNNKEGYALSPSGFKLENLHIDQFLQANAAGEKLLVGKFNGSGSFNGKAKSINLLAQNLKGSLNLNSQNGIMHFLDKDSNAGAGAQLGSTVFKIGGEILGNRVKELSAIGDITRLFVDMNYNSLNVEITREQDLNFNVKNISAHTNEFILKTNGIIVYNPNIDFAKQQIYFPVALLIKEGEIADLFSKAGLSSKRASSEAGYVEGFGFEVNGQLSNPVNNLGDIILKQITSAVGSETQNTLNNVQQGLGGLLQQLSSPKKK